MCIVEIRWPNTREQWVMSSREMDFIFGGIVLHSGNIMLYTTALVFEDIKATVTGEVNS